MRNWMQTLRRASFRGVPFHVDEESLPKTGRRIVRHEWVKAETHATEDMGILPREFRIKAYIASDTADADVQSLMQACETKGAATLVLPFFGAQQVRCEGCAPSHKKDKMGYVELDLEFVAAGEDGGGFAVLPIGDRIVASALDGLGGLVSDALAGFPL